MFNHIFQRFLFMGYSRGTLNYRQRISQSDLTHTMSMDDLVAICVLTLKIDSGSSLGERVH